MWLLSADKWQISISARTWAPASGMPSEAVLGVGIKIKQVSFPGIQDEYSHDRDSIASLPTECTPIT